MAKKLQSTSSWLRWLTPGLQIKRWLLLLMFAELVLVLGVAYALKEIYQGFRLPREFYYITLQFWPYWARAIIFGIVGVGLLLFSYLKLTQSVLGPFLPAGAPAAEREHAPLPISSKTVERLACDASVTRILLNSDLCAATSR